MASSSSSSSSVAGKRLIRSKSGLKVVSQASRAEAPWLLAEPSWMPDQEMSFCMSCKAKFDFIKRRHHCRRCGRIYCGKCCSSRVQFHRMSFVDPVRLCGPCAATTRLEADFFENSLKLLVAGAPFSVVTSTSVRGNDKDAAALGDRDDDSRAELVHCKLSSCSHYLLFDSPSPAPPPLNCSEASTVEAALPPVELVNIALVTPPEGGEDTYTANVGLVLRVKSFDNDEETQYQVKMLSPPEPSRKPSVAWIQVFQQAMTMVFESQDTSSAAVFIAADENN